MQCGCFLWNVLGMARKITTQEALTRHHVHGMKTGFSKNQLKNACNSVNIMYKHVPKVGIDSKLRKNLSDQESYDELFSYYITTLNNESVDEGIKEIIHLLKKFNLYELAQETINKIDASINAIRAIYEMFLSCSGTLKNSSTIYLNKRGES